MTLFWTMAHIWEKWSQSYKIEIEIENGFWYDFDIFDFSSATRGHFSNVSALFKSVDLLLKSDTQIKFVEDRILIEISNKMYNKGLFWALCIASILNCINLFWICYIFQLSTPWKGIFTSAPFWAIVVAHVCNNWGFYTLLTTMPSYMKQVLKFDISSVSFIHSFAFSTIDCL